MTYSDALVLFGISGDLAKKKLFGALYDLTADGALDVPVVGVASTEWDDARLAEAAREAIAATRREVDDAVVETLTGRMRYVQGDYTRPDTYDDLRERLSDCQRPLFYLAIPPGLFDDVIEGLAAAGMSENGRLVLEKPFGRDLASAQELNEIVHRHFDESAIYRIDHFLGKEPVQNLMVYRFANTFLEPIWNRHYIKSVRITMAEDFGVTGRGSFYDAVGTLRDVVQNHLLQIVSLLAMEPPVSSKPEHLRDERVKVLEAMRAVDPADVVRGQYEGYLDEDGVAADSQTETYVELQLEIESWRWAGVPWYIRAGKGMKETVTEAVVELQAPPRPLFADEDCAPGPNTIRFQFKPTDEIVFVTQAKKPGKELVSHPVELIVHHDGHDHGGELPDANPDANANSETAGAKASDAYTRLLGDAMEGDAALFARQDGVEQAWRVVQPVLDSPPEVERYERGTWGPGVAGSIIDDGHW